MKFCCFSGNFFGYGKIADHFSALTRWGVAITRPHGLMGRDGRWREDGNDGGWREEKYGLRGRSGKRGEEDSVDEGKGGHKALCFTLHQ